MSRSNMAHAVSRIALVPFDDVVTGRYPVKGMCNVDRDARADGRGLI